MTPDRNDHLTPLEREIAQWIVTNLNLETTPDEMDPDEQLFYKGLGLDSIDGLEIAMMLSERFGIEIDSETPENETIFSSLRAMCVYIANNRQHQGDGEIDGSY